MNCLLDNQGSPAQRCSSQDSALFSPFCFLYASPGTPKVCAPPREAPASQRYISTGEDTPGDSVLCRTRDIKGSPEGPGPAPTLGSPVSASPPPPAPLTCGVRAGRAVRGSGWVQGSGLGSGSAPAPLPPLRPRPPRPAAPTDCVTSGRWRRGRR